MQRMISSVRLAMIAKLLLLLVGLSRLAAASVMTDEKVQQRSQQLRRVLNSQATAEPPVQCEGELEKVTIDFESTRGGRPLKVGRIPSLLPEGLRISGLRKNETQTASGNCLAMLNTARPRGNHHLRSSTDGMVVLINSNDNPATPQPNPDGGTITLRFAAPVFQVNRVRFLGTPRGQDVDQRSFITGLSATGGQSMGPELIPPSGAYSPSAFVFPDSWFNIKVLKVELQSTAALAELRLTMCRGGTSNHA